MAAAGVDEIFDFLVVGGGIAGLTFALDAARHGQVCLLTKRTLVEANTRYAQGGISAVLDGVHDSFDAHVRDTLGAGAGLCRDDVVRLVVEQGPHAIERLAGRGVAFDRDPKGGLALGREGGHSARRVAHVADLTGRAIEDALAAQVRATPNIAVLEHHMAVDLITRGRLARGTGRGTPGGKGDRVLGVYALDVAADRVVPLQGRTVCLATGGAGKVYLYTSNPDVATGDGVAMAWRAGARIANMEFFQFHPTCLYHSQAKNFLISEAMRGEGGVLRNGKGEAFMAHYDARKDLAPRDIVARAIDTELKRSGDDHVWLDMTHKEGAFLAERFPTIHARCLDLGIDMRSQPIPVVPAAHYQCGGVLTDTDGRTNIAGLFAIGEAACTGLHGANRLASNSLLEGAVMGERAAAAAATVVREDGEAEALRVPQWDTGQAGDPDEAVVVTQSWDEIRRLMWNYVGIVRSNRRLLRARRRLQLISEEVREDYWRFYLTPDLIELRNLAAVASLIVECALQRQESRGLHWSIDFPEMDDEHWRRDTVLVRPQG
ncbi:MAG: L-aspartate oxidase [Myxococcales bacterium]|nr:L-aspartate oxidase [Myxococcales bacterium]